MTAEASAPYPGLREYEEADADFFFGRRHEIRIITSNVLTARLTILYAASGVGKSSLVRAGVASRLRARAGQPLIVHATWPANPLAELKDAIGRELRRLSRSIPSEALELELDEFLTVAGRGLSAPILIILDQFEDYLLYGWPGASQSEQFEKEIAQAINRLSCPAHFLLVIREDVLARLDRLSDRIPAIFDNYLRIEALANSEAEEAIREPLRVYSAVHADIPAAIEDVLVKQIIEQVRGHADLVATPSGARRAGDDGAARENSQIDMPYLQLVLSRLWAEASRERPIVLSAGTLARLGGAEHILQDHFDSVIRALRREQQEVAARVLRFLVTPSGKTNAYSATELASYAEVPVAEVDPVLRRLADQDVRILRPVLVANVRDSSGRYEVAFDILANAALTWRARYIALGNYQWRRTALVFCVIGVAIALVELLVKPPQNALFVTRAMAYVGLSTVMLVQVYRWFLRYVSMSGFLSMRTFRSPLIGIVLSVLLSVLWYLSTNVDSTTVRDWPAKVNTQGFLAFLFTLLVTWSVGVLFLSLMNFLGQITAARFRSFDLGLNTGFILSCVIVAVAVLVTLYPPAQGVPWQIKLSEHFCPNDNC